MAKQTMIDQVLDTEVAASQAAPQPVPIQVAPVQMTPVLFAQMCQQEFEAAEKKRKQSIAKLKAQEKVKIAVPPSYAKYLARVGYHGLNGASVHIPCNGRHFEVPKAFAAIIRGKMRMYDAYELKQARMSDVQNNFESYAGALNF